MKRNLYKGFTLIELLIVIAIIAVLASVVVASVVSARGQAHIAAAATSEHEMTLGASLHEPGGSWSLSEGSGTTVHGNGSGIGDGTIAGGATFSTDVPLNQAYSVNMTPNSSITFPVQQMGLNADAQGVTMGGWFKYTGGPSQTGGVLFTYGSGSNVALVSVGSGAAAGELLFQGGAPSLPRFIIADNILNDGNWHYIVASINASTKTYALYVDGRQVGVGPQPTPTFIDSLPAFLSPSSPPVQFTVGTANDSSAVPGFVSDPFIFSGAIN